MSVTRLRSEKGAFVLSPKGAFQTGVATLLFCTLKGRFNNIRAGDIALAPCFIRDDTGLADDGLVQWDLRIQTQGDLLPRAPTFDEMLSDFNETTWQGNVSTIVFEMGGGTVFCTTLNDGANGSSRVYAPSAGQDRGMFLARVAGSQFQYEAIYLNAPTPVFSAGETFTQI